MATWRSATPLSNTQRAQLREGLLVEYAPGLVVSADLASTPGLRGTLLAPLLPAGYTAVSLTAVWVLTGWWPEGRMHQLYAAHPGRTKPPATHRRAVPLEFTTVVGGTRITTPARTAIDLLLMEAPDVAIEGILHLLGAHTDLAAVADQLTREKRRQRLGFAREVIEALAEYVAWRTEALSLSASLAGCPSSSNQ